MVLFDAWGRDVADAVLIFAFSTFTVAAAWAPRYILGGSFPTLEEVKARVKSIWSQLREAREQKEHQHL